MDKAAPEGRAGKFREWFVKYGLVTVFVPALIPIPMPLKVFVISAGVLGTAPVTFIGVIFAARVVRYFGEVGLGVALGKNSPAFLKTHAWELAVSAVLLFVTLYLFVQLHARGRGKANL